ncbi:MAG: N-acetyltransferase family protein [Cyanobium sp.]
MKELRQQLSGDHPELLEVYRLAVEGCPAKLYTSQQRLAWARQAGTRDGTVPPTPQLLGSLQRGRGLVCCDDDGRIAGFAIREPMDRLALLYCRPDRQGRGHGRALITAMEQQAQSEGVLRLTTEASLVSQPLLERLGWRRSWQEELMINGALFRRFRLYKPLDPILSAWPKPSSSSSSTRSVS